MRVLLTGGAGYIGNVLTRDLLVCPDVSKVTVLDNFFYNQQSTIIDLLDNKKFALFKDDVRNLDLLKDLIKKHDLILPLAAIVGAPACDKFPQLAQEINYEQVRNICNLKSSSQYLILPVTNSGYGIGGEDFCDEDSPLKPISIYGKTKVNAETFMSSSDYFISLRLATVFVISNRIRTDLLVNNFVYKSFFEKSLVLFESKFRRNFIHIRDISNVILFLAKNFNKYKNNIYNVGLDNANLTKLELAQEIKKQIPDLKITEDEFAKDPDKRDYIVSNKKILATGWKPKNSLKEGIGQLIEYYKFFDQKEHTNI